MKIFLFLICFSMIISIDLYSQNWPEEITPVSVNTNDSVTVEGNLSTGKVISDMRWAWSSSNACFTQIQSAKFRGNHVFYGTTIKPGTMMKLKLTPGTTDEMSVYGYMLGENEMYLPPKLPQCITCEADYKRDRPVKWRVENNDRLIEFSNPTENTYTVIIGVSAPARVTERKFSLMLKSISY